MRNRRQGIVTVLALAGTLALAFGSAAQAAHHSAAHKAGGSLTVFAAASLKEAFITIGAAFDRQNGSRTVFNFGGSDTLATQIVQGAPADVFASANMAQMTVVQNKGLLAAAPVVFVRNRLVVIVPKDNPGHVYSLPDLGRPGLRLVLAAPSVPVGKYARAAFTVMASDAAFGPDFLARLQHNIVSNETDVKAVAAKVTLGEADAGVVYVTDVTSKVAPLVHTIEVPPAYNQIAKYPIAAIKGSQNGALARRFVDYVLSPAGQRVLARANFITTAPKGGYAATFQVTGLVSKTLTLSVADLRKMMAVTIKVTLRTDKAVLGTHTFTGVPLINVLQAAIPISNTSFKNDPLRMFVTIGATDGYQATVGMAEILPDFGGQTIVLAYEEDGKPLAHSDGAVELIVPNDKLAGRDVRNVDRVVVGTPLNNQ